LLNEPGPDGELGAAKVNAFETIPIGCAGSLLNFELIGVDHHCQGVFDVELSIVL
jgi:hypothetical protein